MEESSLICFRWQETNSAPPSGDSPWDLAQATKLECSGALVAFGGPSLSQQLNGTLLPHLRYS
jgi:hypothetical protein